MIALGYFHTKPRSRFYERIFVTDIHNCKLRNQSFFFSSAARFDKADISYQMYIICYELTNRKKTSTIAPNMLNSTRRPFSKLTLTVLIKKWFFKNISIKLIIK